MNIQKHESPGQALDQIIANFQQCLNDMASMAFDCGRAIVEMIDRWPEARELIQEKPALLRQHLRWLERIGRGQLLPQLVYSETVSAGRQALRRMPTSDQVYFLASPIEVLLLRDGKSDILKVQLDNLTPDQVRQVFATDHVRDQAEQRAWLESKISRSASVTVEKDYVIKGRTLVIRRDPRPPLSLSKSTLIQILAQLPE